MAAPARPTLPLTCWTRLARSGGPGWARTAAILERGVRPALIYRGLSIQLASRHRAARLYQTLLACLPACLPACLLACLLSCLLSCLLASILASLLGSLLGSLLCCLSTCSLCLLAFTLLPVHSHARLVAPLSVCLSFSFLLLPLSFLLFLHHGACSFLSVFPPLSLTSQTSHLSPRLARSPPSNLPERSVCEEPTYHRRSFRAQPYEPLLRLCQRSWNFVT